MKQPIADRIRNLRVALKLTQTVVAHRMRVTPSDISDWERGVRLPSLKTLPKLAEALETTASDLLEGT